LIFTILLFCYHVSPILVLSATAKAVINTAFKAHIFFKRGRFWADFYHFYRFIHVSLLQQDCHSKKPLQTLGLSGVEK
jgi:hypothetical protein